MIQIAVLGAGHWGPNLIRNFDNRQRSAVRWIVDRDPARLAAAEARFPGAKLTTQPAEAIADPAVDAVVIATPTITHYELAKAALERGKHVLVEKPLADSAAACRELIELAERTERVLLVGHVFLFNPAVRWVKEYLDSGQLGAIYYVSSQRTNLGPIRTDVNAAWDLASQDLSIFNYWLGTTPRSACAVAGTWLNPGIADAVFATLRYPGDVLAHLHVSWLNPRKNRDITVVAQRRMLTYDDMSLSEPIRVYDKRVAEQRTESNFVDTFASFRSSVREGDITIPRVAMGEPLAAECEHFLDCLESKARPQCGGAEALDVVRVLEAISRSIAGGGREEQV